MKKPDDCTLTQLQYQNIRTQAQLALEKADARGCFPTPIAEIMRIAEVQEVHEDVLNPSFIDKIRQEIGKAGSVLKRALGKVMGLFDARARLIFIDRSLHLVKQSFIKLHETAHAFLPWQKNLYAVVEDCENSLDPEVADLFDRQANVFAAEVMFQMDAFIGEAEQSEFGILNPVRLSKKYGASIYSSVRQYVSKNHRACVVLVLNPPVLKEGVGFEATLRRAIPSQTFIEKFGDLNWPDLFTPDDEIGAMVPINKRRMSGKKEMILIDRNGDNHVCIAEAFTQSWQVFILIHSVETLTRKSILITAA